VVARLFALPPAEGFVQPYQCNSDREKEDFRSCSDSEDLERSTPSDAMISFEYLTGGFESGETHPAHELVHVTEMSKMPEVLALELYESQAQDTVVAGSLFTLGSLCFCIFYHLRMRLEVYEDHPWAFVVRLGIFCPPFFVAAFASFIRPYPEKPHYREAALNPEQVRPATQCVGFFAALVSLTCLAWALQLHATVHLEPELRVTEWSVDRWPLFFHPTGVTGMEDSLIITTDFAVARFQLGDHMAHFTE